METAQTEIKDKPKRAFISCEKCGKRLIERLPNGLWKFMFGRSSDEVVKPPVQMLIHGNLKMMCLRRGCDHVNTLNYMPFAKVEGEQETPFIKKEFVFGTAQV